MTELELDGMIRRVLLDSLRKDEEDREVEGASGFFSFKAAPASNAGYAAEPAQMDAEQVKTGLESDRSESGDHPVGGRSRSGKCHGGQSDSTSGGGPLGAGGV